MSQSVKSAAHLETYCHYVEEDSSHVVTVPFVVVVYMIMVVEIWRMPGRVVRFEVIVMAKLIVRRDGGDGQRVLRLQARVCRMNGKVGWRIDFDFEGLVAGV